MRSSLRLFLASQHNGTATIWLICVPSILVCLLHLSVAVSSQTDLLLIIKRSTRPHPTFLSWQHKIFVLISSRFGLVITLCFSRGRQCRRPGGCRVHVHCLFLIPPSFRLCIFFFFFFPFSFCFCFLLVGKSVKLICYPFISVRLIYTTSVALNEWSEWEKKEFLKIMATQIQWCKVGREFIGVKNKVLINFEFLI